MAAELPNMDFQEYLSHTFPGFFLAVTMFMLVDLWSPLDITSLAIKDIAGFLSFIGFVILFGTILGVIIDGIRHSIVEGIFFENIPEYKILTERFKKLYPCDDKYLKHQYFYKLLGNQAKEINDYLVKAVYRYVEFHGNTSISLVPFSIIAPFYFFQVLQMPWDLSVFLAFLSLIIACVCLYSSYDSLKVYEMRKYSIIYGYIGARIILVTNYSEIAKGEMKILDVRLFDKISQKLLCEEKEVTLKSNEKIFCKTTLLGWEKYTNEITSTPDNEGISRIKVMGKNPGVVEITASTEKYLSNTIYINIKQVQ